MAQTSPSKTVRAISPTYNATGLASAIAAIYAAVVLILNAIHHKGAIDPQVIVAAVSAVAFLYARFKVTPIADPKDGNGNALTPTPAPNKPDVAVVPTPVPSPEEVHDV